MTALEALPVALEPRWLGEVCLRASRRVLWCRELWERHRYLGDDALAIGHGEVDSMLDVTAAGAEAEFYATDERAAAATASLASLLELGPDPVLAWLIVTAKRESWRVFAQGDSLQCAKGVTDRQCARRGRDQRVHRNPVTLVTPTP